MWRENGKKGRKGSKRKLKDREKQAQETKRKRRTGSNTGNSRRATGIRACAVGDPNLRTEDTEPISVLTLVAKVARDVNKCLTQYDEVYKDLTKNQTQLLMTDFIIKSRRSEIVPNSSTIEPESHQVLSSEESDIISIRN